MNKAADRMAGDDEAYKSRIRAAQLETAPLLSLYKYELGTVKFNPSFVVVAEKMEPATRFQNGKEYLQRARYNLSKTKANYRFEKEIVEKTIGSQRFYLLASKSTINDFTVTQEYITTIMNGFSLSFVISYITETERQELYEIVNQIKI